MTIREQFILDKMAIAKEHLTKARKFFDTMENNQLLQSELHLHTLERYLQLIVDATLDINNHIIKELDLEPAKDLKSTFLILSDNKILEESFAQKISGVVGLRNQIVHQYEKIDNKKFLHDFRKHNLDFDEYFKEMLSFLEKNSL